MANIKEVFKPIPNYEGLYEISNMCNVKSLPKRIQRGKYNAWRNIGEKILSSKNGEVSLTKDGQVKTFKTKTLYKIVFEGFIPDGKRKICLINNNDKIVSVSRRKVCQIVKSFYPKKTNYTGVSKSGNNYRAAICINQKDIYLGTFISEIDASNIYQLACKNEMLYNGNAKDFRTELNRLL